MFSPFVSHIFVKKRQSSSNVKYVYVSKNHCSVFDFEFCLWMQTNEWKKREKIPFSFMHELWINDARSYEYVFNTCVLSLTHTHTHCSFSMLMCSTVVCTHIWMRFHSYVYTYSFSFLFLHCKSNEYTIYIQKVLSLTHILTHCSFSLLLHLFPI